MRRLLIAAAMLPVAACQHAQPGIQVRTVTVEKAVEKPCPGKVPVRPAPLGPLASDEDAALAQVLAALAAYSAPGKYADQAEAYFRTCPPVG